MGAMNQRGFGAIAVAKTVAHRIGASHLRYRLLLPLAALTRSHDWFFDSAWHFSWSYYLGMYDCFVL